MMGADSEAPPPDAPTILIVEDNADVREYLKSHLAGRYRIEEAADGVEGLETTRGIDVGTKLEFPGSESRLTAWKE